MTVQEPEQDLNSPREECGVFGVWAPGEEVAKLTYYGLYALQHRGQEAAGIAVADGSQVLVFKDLGLVSQVFDEQTLAAMHGHVAIGHCRYSTTGDTTWENAQPVFRNTAAGTGVALGHNGNLVNTAELAARARDAGLIGTRCPAPATTDSDILGALLAHGAADSTLEQAALELLPADDDADRTLESWAVADALASLRPDHRRVIIETYYRGCSVAEAAATLGIPPGTVKSRTFYALKALKLALQERGLAP